MSIFLSVRLQLGIKKKKKGAWVEKILRSICPPYISQVTPMCRDITCFVTSKRQRKAFKCRRVTSSKQFQCSKTPFTTDGNWIFTISDRFSFNTEIYFIVCFYVKRRVIDKGLRSISLYTFSINWDIRYIHALDETTTPPKFNIPHQVLHVWRAAYIVRNGTRHTDGVYQANV